MTNHEGNPVPPQEPDPILKAIDDVVNTMGLNTRLTEEITGRSATVFFARDRFGEDIGSPAIPGALVIDGKNNISGVVYYTAERDERGRPTRVTGFCTGDGVADALWQGFAENVARIDDVQTGDEAETSYEPDFSSGGHEEIELRYDPVTGLLSEVVETSTGGDTARKTVHTNYFGADGRRTGYIKRELVDIVAAGKDEVYETTELRLYERNEGSCREIMYVGYRDGLIPARVSEYDPDFKVRGKIYYNDLSRKERLPYKIAANPSETTLYADSGTQRSNQITLPTWVPKDSIGELVHSATSLAEAATMPIIPEAEGKTLIDLDTALTRAYGAHSEAHATDFINSIMAGEEVVVHTGNGMLIEESTLEKIMRDARFGGMPEHQKLALLTALHPACGGHEVNIDALSIYVDRTHCEGLLLALNMSATDVRRVINSLTAAGGGLTAQARARFDYLLPDGIQ